MPQEQSEAAKREEETLAFWEREQIFAKSLAKLAPKGDYIFYEGPPTANGKPGLHHLESRAYKDAIPRYKTMRGYRVPRRAGWDTQGLPVELEVEKELGFTSKQDIEKYGIAAFNTKCRESVLRYIAEWARFTKRIGYWVDQADAYFTFDAPYMEQVWGVIKKVSDDGRLYKDYKVLPWCPHDQTALSSHELAQGYQDVKDLSLTAKFELIEEPGTYLLAWTTTPWTLPGNVALAVGEKIEYGKYEKEGLRVILADARAAHVLGEGWRRVADAPAAALIGKHYRPLYSFAEELAPPGEKEKFVRAFQVYPAPFVTTEDGTGIVHTAVMYGQEDFELGNALGLPKVHLVAPDGTFIPGTKFLEGRFVKDEAVAVDIVKDLAARELLFSKESHLHSYPFCWRCKTPLIYYARDSWYIRMQDLRGTLVAENNKVNWQPSHIREGRMGEWLANAKDWALSRERYWGTPLPVWQDVEGKERVVVGSVDELKKRVKKSGNKYWVMRHGEATNNTEGVISSGNNREKHLTPAGTKQVEAVAPEIRSLGIDLIVSSPLDRTKETAELLTRAIGYSGDVLVEDRLKEGQHGALDGQPISAFWEAVPTMAEWLEHGVPGGESYTDIKRRAGDALYALESTYHDKRILIVTHDDPAAALFDAALGRDKKQILDTYNPAGDFLANAEVRELDFVPLPHNEDYELDLHRPYIDEIVLTSDSGKELRRVKEVMDVWLDSGAMPFATHSPYPADFISEAIDQTRGWFYTLLAVGTLMGKGAPYKNVICLGHLLDSKGQKMSKSRGNIVEPFAEIEKWGADAVRFWMYYVNQPGDSKNYDEKTLKEAARVLSWLENSAKFYELFKDVPPRKSKQQVIDRWMRARVSQTIRLVTTRMDSYHPYEATRWIGELAEDISQWYVRRIRDRVREGDDVALTTLRETLHTCALLLAPFAPFLAEDIFALTKDASDPESVHLAAWPQEPPRSILKRLFGFGADEKLISEMVSLRAFVTVGLRVRQEGGVKLRQPLASFSFTGKFSEELEDLLAEELNVKKVVMNALTTGFDFTLTPELRKEGDLREYTRSLADARKARDLSPSDTVSVVAEQKSKPTLGVTSFKGVSSTTYTEAEDLPFSSVLSDGSSFKFDIKKDAA